MPVIKILTRTTPTYGGLVDYLMREGKGKDGQKPVIITHNFRGTDKEEWVREFMENESWRQYSRKGNIMLYHEIMSFSDKENPEAITREMLEDLANKYIDIRGRDGMYLAAFHEDKDHAHIHFAVSGVKFKTGMAHRLTHDALHELKDTIQTYQKDKYPEVLYSSPEHGKGKDYETNAEYFLRKRTERTNGKAYLKEKVTSLYNQAKNQYEFLELLQNAGFLFYERNGIPTGIIHDDMKYRFSRLDIPFDRLAIDITEQENTLEEIRAIREHSFDLDRDEMDFSRYVHMNPNSLFE